MLRRDYPGRAAQSFHAASPSFELCFVAGGRKRFHARKIFRWLGSRPGRQSSSRARAALHQGWERQCEVMMGCI